MKYFNRSNIIYPILTIFVMIVAFLGFIAMMFSDTRKDTEAQMNELGRQSVSMLSNKLQYDAACLRSISETIGNSRMEIGSEEMRQYMKRKQRIYGFGDLIFIDAMGDSLSASGVKFPNQRYMYFFQTAMDNKIVLAHGIDYNNRMDRVVRIAVPLYRDFKIRGVLLGTYMPHELNDLLSRIIPANSYGNVKIITSTGDLVVAPSSHFGFLNMEDFFDSSDTEISVEEYNKFYAAIQHGTPGSTTYTFKGQKLFATLTPMQIQNFTTIDCSSWSLSLAIPYEQISAKAYTRVFQASSFAFILLAVIGDLLYAMYRLSQKKADKLAEAYEEIKSLYRTIPTPIIRFRMEDGGIVISDNRSFANLVGCPHETCQHRFRFFTKQEFIDRLWSLPDGAHQMELPIRAFGKKYIWHEGIFEITTKPEGREVLCVLINIEHQREQLNKMALASQTDALTGLANRRGIQERLGPLFKQESTRGALLIMDLNNFKQVNDQFGHQTGDAVLSDFADMLVTSLPKEAFVCRYGGDEFLAFVPNAAQDDVSALTEKIKEKLLEAFPEYAEACSFGVSFGSVFVPESGRDWDTLFTKMDDMLYQNKRQSKLAQHDEQA